MKQKEKRMNSKRPLSTGLQTLFTRPKRVSFWDTRFWAGHFAALSTPTLLCHAYAWEATFPTCLGSHSLRNTSVQFTVVWKMSISVFWATYLPSCFPKDEHGVCLLHMYRNTKRNYAKKTVGAFLAIYQTDFLPIDFSRPKMTFSSNSVQSVPAKSRMEYAH